MVISQGLILLFPPTLYSASPLQDKVGWEALSSRRQLGLTLVVEDLWRNAQGQVDTLPGEYVGKLRRLLFHRVVFLQSLTESNWKNRMWWKTTVLVSKGWQEGSLIPGNLKKHYLPQHLAFLPCKLQSSVVGGVFIAHMEERPKKKSKLNFQCAQLFYQIPCTYPLWPSPWNFLLIFSYEGNVQLLKQCKCHALCVRKNPQDELDGVKRKKKREKKRAAAA